MVDERTVILFEDRDTIFEKLCEIDDSDLAKSFYLLLCRGLAGKKATVSQVVMTIKAAANTAIGKSPTIVSYTDFKSKIDIYVRAIVEEKEIADKVIDLVKR